MNADVLRRLQPTTADRELASMVYRQYAAKPGADHIASEFALAHLSAIVTSLEPASVLEFGAGIGTISQLLLQHPHVIGSIIATEGNEFCIDQFHRNIDSSYASRIELITEVDAAALAKTHYDLVVIDGLLGDGQYGTLGAGTICFVEGSRKSTRRAIVDSLARRGLGCDFVNYHQGVRYFWFEPSAPNTVKRRLPKFKLRKLLKGFWVGRVQTL